MKVIIEREVTTAEAGAIAITAAEGGIGYWAVLDQYSPRRWCRGDDFEPVAVPEDYVFYTIVGGAEGAEGLDDLRDDCVALDVDMDLQVTPRLIARGIQLFLSGAPGFEARPFADMDDLAAMDSVEADCVIQLGVFGTLVYG